jgi:hypothetical protein
MAEDRTESLPSLHGKLQLRQRMLQDSPHVCSTVATEVANLTRLRNYKLHCLQNATFSARQQLQYCSIDTMDKNGT